MWALAAALLASCSGTGGAHAPSTAPAPQPAPATAPAPPPVPRTKQWFALDVGDCVTGLPAVDTGAVNVDVVDCTTPHLAEVYLRQPTAVDTAIADVANATCRTGLAGHTRGGPFVATYLIDSTQDRTSDNPLPSTIICLLQAADGHQLTAPAGG